MRPLLSHQYNVATRSHPRAFRCCGDSPLCFPFPCPPPLFPVAHALPLCFPLPMPSRGLFVSRCPCPPVGSLCFPRLCPPPLFPVPVPSHLVACWLFDRNVSGLFLAILWYANLTTSGRVSSPGCPGGVWPLSCFIAYVAWCTLAILMIPLAWCSLHFNTFISCTSPQELNHASRSLCAITSFGS